MMTMSLPNIFTDFVQQSPVTVMMRGILERVMSPEKLDELFEKTAQQQYKAWAIIFGGCGANDASGYREASYTYMRPIKLEKSS